jgi:glycosyltransferase involved in cell wall biosynthesis
MVRTMLSGRNILCISSIDWEFNWQAHQEIMSTLVGQGNRVLFLENTGVRAAGLRDFDRLRRRWQNRRRGGGGFWEPRPGLVVCSPVVVPLPYSSLARRLNVRILGGSLRRWMRAAGFDDPIAWTFLPSPLACALIREIGAPLTVYHCVDDLPSSSPAAGRLHASEAALFRDADLVFVTSERLRQKAARHRAEVHRIPPGVRLEKFQRAEAGPAGAPSDLGGLGRPVVGYVGGLHRWLDQELVAAVADRLPAASFVFVGPIQTDVSRLAARPNVRMLGARPHDELPRYIERFDVGLIPYRLTEYTAHVFPTKLYQHLAMGIPVVSADLPEIRELNARHADLVGVARDPVGFAAEIERAAGQTSAAAQARRIAVARENSWERQIARMAELVEAALTTRECAGHLTGSALGGGRRGR